MKKSMLSTKQSYLMCAVGIVVLFGILMGVCESGMASTYIKGIMMTSCIAIIMTTSLNLTIGVLGQLTLGCCGFEAIGAYSAALLSKLLVANGVAMDPTLRFLLTTLAGGVRRSPTKQTSLVRWTVRPSSFVATRLRASLSWPSMFLVACLSVFCNTIWISELRPRHIPC